MSFQLREGGYDIRDHQGDGTTPEREQMADAGWNTAARSARGQAFQERSMPTEPRPRRLRQRARCPRYANGDAEEVQCADGRSLRRPCDPERRPGQHSSIPQRAEHRRGARHRHGQLPRQQWRGPIHRRSRRRRENRRSSPRPSRRRSQSDNFTITDFYESKMSEYDAKYVFVPIRKLQELRGMIDSDDRRRPDQRHSDQTEAGRQRRSRARQAPRRPSTRNVYGVYTWRDKQGAVARRRPSGNA